MDDLTFDVAACRQQFPALARQLAGEPIAYFDGPGGSQVPRTVAEAVSQYLLRNNANSHGEFATSRETDAMLASAQQAMADFVGADDPREVYFGPNMTTLTFALSRALARSWQPGDEIIVTQLDHDANVTPWKLAARDAGVKVQQVKIRSEDCTLDLDDLRSKLNERTRLVAVGAASNATGTVNPIREIVEQAHAVGAEVFLDAVHYAPHRLIDVQAWGCDYLACSAYKFFGPHVGIMWGRRERLEALEAYKVRPAPNSLPGKWMTGTQNHEGIAGTLAAVEYLSDLGRGISLQASTRRQALQAAFAAIAHYEQALSLHMLNCLMSLPSVTIHGITDRGQLDSRVPTFAITHKRYAPHALDEYLASQGIFLWHGNFYALSLSEALQLEPEGMLRVGLLHYNTRDEIDRLIQILARLE